MNLAYNHQTDGQIEVPNPSLMHYICSFVHKKPSSLRTSCTGQSGIATPLFIIL